MYNVFDKEKELGDIMTYREKGISFCEEINNLLSSNNIKAAFVTGGGYAYDSIKYQDNSKNGDFDFMIVYDNVDELYKVLNVLKSSEFKFEEKYLDLDLELLLKDKIDIIRLSGKYLDTKSTINLVPKNIIKELCDFESNKTIRKIAHNRNTSLFFSYGSDNSRIIVNFISPSFVTDDGEDHYIHLDFSHIEKDNNIYLGILSDAILKGFNENYDVIGFKDMRKVFIKNIHNFFLDNGIDSSCFINLFSNNNYFPDYLKTRLLEEFNSMGTITGNIEKSRKLEPMVFTTNFNIEYKSEPFNFINNKEYKCVFIDYINMMQNNEYDRQYLLDAIGKFFGYLNSSKQGNEKYVGSILDKILVYGVNDLYLPEYEKYTMESIVDSIISDLNTQKESLNNELLNDYLIICAKFLSNIDKKSIINVLSKKNIDINIFNKELNQEMEFDVLSKINNFNEIGTYHNYSSKVMPKYTETEVQFISDAIRSKNDKILDVMCGYGRIANGLVGKGYSDVTGIDSENYTFLGVPKNFKFINKDYLKYNFKNRYDCAYSLYNCYSDITGINHIISKTHSILNKDGIFIMDFFNKKWRDSIDPDFYKKLYDDGTNQLIIRRSYDSNKGDEYTCYELYHEGMLMKKWDFLQRFFNLEDVVNLIDLSDWDYLLSNSSDLTTRTNEQKNIMILRKKNGDNNSRR